MQKKGSSRKSLIIGIIAAVVVLCAVLALVLTQCTGQGESTAPSTTVETTPEVPTYELYWNIDRELYEGKSEAGMSSRMPESDGYFHVRFSLNGEEVTLKVQDRKLINKIDVTSIMGLVFDENGVVIDVMDIKEMPVERLAWQFYVQSAGKTLIKANSSESYAGMEVLLELSDNSGVYDMTGKEGAIGCVATPIDGDRIMAVANLAGEVTHVFIYERPNFMLTHEAECQHCEKTVTWYEWVREDKLPVKAGHYQLMNDIALSGQMSITEQDQKICIDLNGKRVDGKNGTRMYSLHNAGSHVAIMDTSEGQTGVMAAHGTAKAQGMVVWVRYGQFHLYSGTLDASDATAKYHGVAVQVPKNAYFYMNGGTIIGGTSMYVQNSSGGYSYGYGGSVSVAGKFVMNDGEIRDGIAKSVTYKKNGTSTTTRGYGGNLFVSGSGEVELNGGVIKNGTAGSAGGNLYLDGACTVTLNGTKIQGGHVTGKGKNGGSIYIGSKGTLNIKSGSVTGGYSYNAGGNIYVNGSLIMSGGSISGGKCYNYTTKKLNESSTNYNVFVVNGRFKMYGGRIYGGVGVTDTSSTDSKTAYVGLATYATIKSDVEGAKNLTLNTGSTITCRVDKLRDTATIGINTARGLFTAPTLEENTDNFFSDIEGAEVIYTEDGLFLGREKCVCGKETHINGCDGTKYLWAPWISTTSAPKTNGNYYLLKDVTTTGQAILSKGHTVRLDLNGHNVTYDVSPSFSDGYRVYRSAFESLLVITDTTDNPGTIRSEMPTEAEVLAHVQAKLESGDYDQAKADKIIAAQKGGNFGSVIWARGGDVILHNGILDGSNLNGTKNGMTVYVAANTASEDGGVTRKGSFTMYGGEIRGATSTSYGCSLYGSSSSNIYIHGGVIRDGVTTGNAGGNVYTLGYFYMDGGVIRDGKAYSSGGNLVLDGAKADATITGTAKILNGQAGDPTLEKDIGRGGNIRVVTKGAKLTLGGDALVSGGIAYRSASNNGGYAGNISVNTDTTMIMNGGTVEGGESYRGGNIDVCGSLTISGGTITGGKAIYGGNIYLLNGTGRELIMTGGTIEKGHATSSGGNIYALAPVTISGGIVAEGKALADSGVPSTNNQGGNICTYGELVISGDTIIRDGVSGSYGGNIATAVDGSLIGDITICDNAQILGGKVDCQKIEKLDGGYGGNIRMLSGTKLVVRDNARIADGYANGGKYVDGVGGGGQGGNIYMTSADVQILGGVIENGTGTGGGGNIGIGSATSGTLLIQDAIIRNGTAGTNYGGNIRIRSGVQQLTITGKTQILGGIAGEGGNIHIDASSQKTNVEISGDALITGGNVGDAGNGPTIYLNKNVDMHVTENAVIDATEAVGKRGGAIYMYDNSSSLTVDGNAKLLGTKHEAMTHGGAGYLRGNVTIGGDAKIIAGDNGSYGNAIYFYTGNLTLKDDALVDASGTTCTNGTALYVYSTSNVTVEGRVVLNGGQTTGAGGTVFVENANSTLSFTGATIDGGKAGSSGGNIYTKSDLTLVDTLLTHGEAGTGSGGNLYMTSCDVTMTGGYITGGTNGMTYSGSSKPNGGNVYISSSATFTLNSGSVDGGKTINTGGNIVCYGKFVMNGGQIFGGCKLNSDGTIANSNATNGNVYVINADMEMHGGHINGGVAVYGDSTLKLSGNPSMTSSYEGEGANELFITGAAQSVTIEGTLTTEGRVAKVRSGSNSDRIFSTETNADNAAFFEAYTEGESVFLNGESKLEIGKVMCICGFKNGKHIGDCDGTEYKWSAWTDTKYLPTTTGYYYLTADLETAGTSAVTANNQKIALDLNGHTIYSTSGGSRIFCTYKSGTYYGGTKLTLVNSGDYGYIQGWNKGGDGKASVDNGSILWAPSANTTFNLYNIILDASANTNSSGKYGGAISLVGTNCKLNVFNSTILGGKSQQGDAIAMGANKTDLKIRLEGDVVITGTEGSVIYLGGEGNTIDVSKLNSMNAPLAVDGTGVFTAGWNKDLTIADYFVSADENSTIVLEGNELALRPYHCICEMPDGKHVEGFCDGTKFVWKPWSKSYMPSTGNWYLTGDVTEATDYRILSAEGAVVRVDLNGYNFTSGKNRMFTTYKSGTATDLTIEVIMTNTKADDRSVVTISGAGDQGRVMWLRGENKTLKVNNIDFVAAEGATSTNNGFFFSAQPQSGTNKTGNHLELYNVTMTGGTATKASSAGALCGGANTSVVLKDVTITGCSGTEGGAIRMVSNSALTMENVTFDGCSTTGKGAAIYATGTCAVSMNNVSITGSTAANDKGVYLNDHATLTMTGTVVADIYRTANTTLDVADLAEGSAITVSGDPGVISANDYTADDADLAYLSAASDDQYLLVVDGKLTLKGANCICGMPDGKHVAGFCDGTLRKWQPWSGTKAPTQSGNYFLTGDVTFSGTGNMATTDGNIVIDLNGHNITIPAAASASAAGRMYTTYTSAGSTSSVNIKLTNTTSTASTVKVEGGGDQGRIIWLTGSNKSFSMYNVGIDMSAAATREEKRLDGIAIDVEGSGNEVKLFDMNIIGGTTTSQGGALFVGYGSNAVLNRCVVDGCEAKVGLKSGSASGGYGGFAYVRGNMTLNDCTIQNCTAEKSGAAIYLYGNSETKRAKLIVNGGSIENCVGSGDNGGAINLQAYADAEMADVTIKNCSAKNAGAVEIKEGNTLEMTDCMISGCSGRYAGAIYVNSSTEGSPATLIMDNCTIDGCSATTGYGGAIVTGVTDGTATYAYAELNNTTIKNCSAKGRGGAIHVSNGSEVVLNGCSIEKNTDTARAGAIYTYKGKLTVLDSTIKNNTVTGSSGKGGAIYLYSADMTVGGKTVITGNTVAGKANNVYLNGRTITVSSEKPLAAGSSIGVTGSAGNTVATTAYANKAYFTSDVDTLDVIHDGSKVKLTEAGHWHCVCGGQPTGDPNHKCVDVKFEVIETLDGRPALAPGNYYLADDFAITHISGTEPTVDVKGGTVVNFCLDGHTLSGAGLAKNRVFLIAGAGNLTLTSCKEGAKIDNASKYEGGLIKVNDASSCLNIYGGITIDGSAHTGTSTSTYGAAIHSKGTFNLYNATIIGSAKTDNATAGGTVTVAKDSVMNMYGGTIKDGISKTNTGNMYLSGTLNMMGGTITGGGYFENDATNYEHRAANIHVSALGVLNMTGGIIDGHVYAGTSGATVKLSGDAKILDSTRSLWVVPGNTNVLIGDLSDKAEIHVNVFTSGNATVYGVIASAQDGYTITEQDASRILAKDTSGAKKGNIVLNSDNTISVVKE